MSTARSRAPAPHRPDPPRASPATGGIGAGLHWWCGLCYWLCLMVICQEVSGFERSIDARIANYDEAPVTLLNASAQLLQTYGSPSQFPFAVIEGGHDIRISRARVHYMNRHNQQIPTYLLEGELEIRNTTQKEVTALQITTVFLNAFRERISTERRSFAQSLAPRRAKRIQWSRGLPHEEVFEMFFVVTAVRFSDGTVWAPTEELVALP